MTIKEKKKVYKMCVVIAVIIEYNAIDDEEYNFRPTSARSGFAYSVCAS